MTGNSSKLNVLELINKLHHSKKKERKDQQYYYHKTKVDYFNLED